MVMGKPITEPLYLSALTPFIPRLNIKRKQEIQKQRHSIPMIKKFTNRSQFKIFLKNIVRGVCNKRVRMFTNQRRK